MMIDMRKLKEKAEKLLKLDNRKKAIVPGRNLLILAFFLLSSLRSFSAFSLSFLMSIIIPPPSFIK